jgi:hypothetical protein
LNVDSIITIVPLPKTTHWSPPLDEQPLTVAGATMKPDWQFIARGMGLSDAVRPRRNQRISIEEKRRTVSDRKF